MDETSNSFLEKTFQAIEFIREKFEELFIFDL